MDRERALQEVADYLHASGDAAIVAHEGSADDVVATMLASGHWRLSDEVVYMHGKRIRTLIPVSD